MSSETGKDTEFVVLMSGAIGKLNRAVMDTLADPTIRQRLVDLAQEIPPRDQQAPMALAALQKAAIEKWWPIINAAGIKAE